MICINNYALSLLSFLLEKPDSLCGFGFSFSFLFPVKIIIGYLEN